jgi:hypothetical protein
MSEQIYFLHIPKTGGGSLKRIVARQFTAEQIAPMLLMQHLAEGVTGGHDLGKYGLIHGHFGHTLLSYLPARPRVITMLREPVARTVSRFRWAGAQGERGPTGNVLTPGTTIEQYIEPEWAGRLLTDFQTRNLALDFDLNRSYQDRGGNKILLSQSQLLTHTTTDLSDDELLARAKQRLASFEFVGVTERFTESVQLMCHTFGWPEPSKQPHAHKTANSGLTSESLSADTQAKIEDLTRLDAELYRFACDLFENRYAEFCGRIP